MKTWNTVDKSGYAARGEWDNEVDKAQWVSSGLDCLVVRGPLGAFCGYVGVPKDHVEYQEDYNDVSVDVHGGLTFADKCSPNGDEARGICHTGPDIANGVVWWLGFDCSHYSDLAPKAESPLREHCTYRNFEYVKAEVEKLAEQLA